MRIDSHQHFWKFDPIRDSWINNSMTKFQKPISISDSKEKWMLMEKIYELEKYY